MLSVYGDNLFACANPVKINLRTCEYYGIGKMNTKARLSELIGSLGLSQAGFAASINASPSTVSEWLSRPNKNPSLDALVRICETHSVNLNWLLTGEGSMFFNNERARVKESDWLELPVVADIAAGPGIDAFDVEPEEYISVARQTLTLPGPYLAFRVQGSSMEPYIWPNDYVVVTERWHELDVNNRICAFRTHNGLTLKRFYIHDRRKYSLLLPLNPDHPVIQYTPDDPDYLLIGILILSFRKYEIGE